MKERRRRDPGADKARPGSHSQSLWDTREKNNKEKGKTREVAQHRALALLLSEALGLTPLRETKQKSGASLSLSSATSKSSRDQAAVLCPRLVFTDKPGPDSRGWLCAHCFRIPGAAICKGGGFQALPTAWHLQRPPR